MATRKIPKCKKHPKYKAVRAPTADCDDCHEQHFAVFKAVLKIQAKQLKILKKAQIYQDGDYVDFIITGKSDPDVELAKLEIERRNLYK
jgi:hypothetical protein